MPDFKTPGVYIIETPKLPPSIASVETAIPAFIGYTQKADLKVAGDLIRKPTRITSMLEYEKYFCKADPEPGITVTFVISGPPTAPVVDSVTATVNPATDSVHNLYYSLQHFYANG